MVIGGHLFKKNLKTGGYGMVLQWVGYDLDSIEYFVKYCDRLAEHNNEYFVDYFKILEDGCFTITSDKIWEILDGVLSSK